MNNFEEDKTIVMTKSEIDRIIYDEAKINDHDKKDLTITLFGIFLAVYIFAIIIDNF